MRLPEVSRNTKLLGIASFLTDLSSEMIFPLLPFFMTNILLAPVFVIGIMESIGEFVVSVAGFLSGIYSDRIGKRKRLIIFGYSISALFKSLLLVISSWHQMVVLRIFERAGKGIREMPRDALIGLSEPKGNVGNAFGFRKMMDNIGALLGPLAASILIALFFNGEHSADSYRLIFAAALLPAAFTVISLLFIRDIASEGSTVSGTLNGIFASGRMRGFLLAGAIFSLGQFSLMFFLLRANDFMPLLMIPLAYLVYNVFYTIFAMPAGILSDRFGARAALLLGMLCFLLALAGFAFFPSKGVIFAMFAVLGFFMAITETAPQILLIRTVDRTQYASAIGAYKGITGIVGLPANLMAGALYAVTVSGAQLPALGFLLPAAGCPATFLFSIATTALGIAAVYFLIK